MNPIVKSIAKPIYYKAQDNALGKKSISLAFTYRKENDKRAITLKNQRFSCNYI